MLAACAVGALPASAPAAYAVTLTAGTTATFTGDTNFNQLRLRGHTVPNVLEHNRFLGDPGFASDLDFDSVAGSMQMLANTPASILNVNGGAGARCVHRAETERSASLLIQAELDFDGGAGQDFALGVFWGDGNQIVTVGGGADHPHGDHPDRLHEHLRRRRAIHGRGATTRFVGTAFGRANAGLRR